MARKLNRRTNTEETRRLVRVAVRLARKTNDRVKEEQWLAWCASLDSKTPISFLWRKIRSVGRGATTRQAIHPLPQEEADHLTETFASRSAMAPHPPDIHQHQVQANTRRWRIYHEACRGSHPADAALQPHELRHAIPGRNNAPGENEISYAMLRHAEPEMEAERLHLMNQSYASRTIPATWRTAAIVPIPKAGDSTQYRPISLLSCLAKTMERILYTRLEWVLGPLHQHLFAFRRGKGLID